MKKIIYTAILNDYDSLKEPTTITPSWEYICITNNPLLKSNVWKFIFINDYKPKDERRYKIEVPFDDWVECIWLDGSIKINCNLDTFVNQFCKKDLVLLKHPHRGCIYEEALECIKRKKDTVESIRNQTRHYLSENYPINNGLVATGVMYRKNTEVVKDFCHEWWREVERFSVRDQLSFNPVHHRRTLQKKANPEFAVISFNILRQDFLLNYHKKHLLFKE